MSERIKVIVLDIESPDGTVSFHLIAQEVSNVDELQLPLVFYGGNGLKFPHWEVEIVDPVYKRGETGKLNYHFSDRNGQSYVCYPQTLPENELVPILQIWAVGQVCVLKFDRHLNEMITEAGGNDKFLIWAKNTAGMRVSDLIVI